MSQSGWPLCIGEDIRSFRSLGLLLASKLVVSNTKSPKSATNTHLASQPRGPVDIKISPMKTKKSAIMIKRLLWFITHLCVRSRATLCCQAPLFSFIPSVTLLGFRELGC